MTNVDPLVCIVDDDISAREGMAGLALSAGFQVETFASAREYLAKPRSAAPACLVLDVNLPGLSGLELQRELCRGTTNVPIVFVTGHADIPMSVRAIKAGASDFLTKPFDPDALLSAIQAGMDSSKRAPIPPAAAPDGDGHEQRLESDNFPQLVGRSRALTAVLAQVLTVARTDSTVLIHGETGTGKELIARAIHDASERMVSRLHRSPGMRPRRSATTSCHSA